MNKRTCETYAQLLEVVERTVEQSSAGIDITLDTGLFGEEGETLGLDSLDTLDLISKVEEAFGVQLPDDIFSREIHTLGDLGDLLAEQQ